MTDKEIINKTIFITGSRNAILWWGKNIINIGCQKRTIEEWKVFYKNVGQDYNYSASEIAEYYEYILIIEKMQSKTVIEKVKP